MAAQLGRQEMYRLARLGAESRLAALELERAGILRSFPDLAGARGGSGVRASGGQAPRRNRMSAAARKAVSVRMKKYWANRRKNAAKNT